MYSKEEYYHKADNLIRISCQAIQTVFRDRWKAATSTEWTEESAQTFIQGEGKEFYQNLKGKQKDHLRNGDLEEWDLNLLTDIILRVKIFAPDNETRRKMEEETLKRLRTLRNELAHNAQKKINTSTFQKFEDTVRHTLTALGISIDKVEKLISQAGVTSSETALEQFRKIQKLGEHAFSKRNYSQAIKHCDEALLVPSVLPVNLCSLYTLKASCYLELGKRKQKYSAPQNANLDQAMKDIEQALEHNSASWQAHGIMASIYKLRNEMPKAIEHFYQALAISPGQSKLKEELEECKLLHGQMLREDHMHPQRMPKTLEEVAEHYSKASGFNITPEQFVKRAKMGEMFLPGTSDVQAGHRYAHGAGVPQNYQEAARYFRKGMSKGNAEGIYNLAILYFEGNGVRTDIPYAIELLKMAANMPEKIKIKSCTHVDIGVRAAQHSLGLRYGEGIGVPQDYKQAAHWYKKAASNGCGNAANNLGILYSNGLGVDKDLEMAEMYWKRSAEAGNTDAAFCLCTYYVDEMEPDSAKFWLEKSIQLGHKRLPVVKKEMMEMIEHASSMRKLIENTVLKFEKDHNLTVDNLTFRKRKDRMMVAGVYKMTKEATQHETPEEANARANAAAESYANLVKSNPFSVFLNGDSHRYRFTNDNTIGWAGMFQRGKQSDFDEIIRRAEEGSVTAKRILAVIGYNEYFFKLWGNGPPFSDQRVQTIIHFAYLINCMEQHLFSYNSEEMQSQYYNTLSIMFKTHCGIQGDLDKMIRFCYALQVKDRGYKYRIEVLKEGINRYPNEVSYYDILSSFYGIMEKFELGLQVANQGLRRFPNAVDLLYFKAVAYRLTDRCQEEVREAFDRFIQLAPEDHRKVPEAYYCIAMSYYNAKVKLHRHRRSKGKPYFGTETCEKIVQYYEKALMAEKVQLPCYLPYDSSTKTLATPIFMEMRARIGTNAIINSDFEPPAMSVNLPTGDDGLETKKNLPNILKTNTSKKYLKDPKRIETIRAHRQTQHDVRKGKVHEENPGIHHVIASTVRPSVQQKPLQNLRSLQEITLKEMDPTQDKVYEQKVLNLTLIEDPTISSGFNSIHSIAMDDHKEVVRLYVYKVPHNQEMREKLGFGSRLSILNPYLRMCGDWKNAIRVDEPNCIVYKEKIENLCRYCVQENNELKSCSKCKWAKYCSRQCQLADWKELNHKLICKPK